MENIVTLAYAHEDEEGLIQKIALLEGELAEARRAREVAEEKSRVLSNAAVDAERRWEVFEKGRWEHFEELILLQT
jgi:ribonuclease D